MLAVLPVFAGDEPLALLNLRLAAQYNGQTKHRCLIVCPAAFNAARVISAAKACFPMVYVTQYPPCPVGEKWPAAPNWAWQCAARAVQQLPEAAGWLWWEPDAVPMRSSWLDDIEAVYLSGAKQHAFAGCIVRNGATRTPYLAGVAVYPVQVQRYASAALQRLDQPFDILLSAVDGILPNAQDIRHVLLHEYRADGGGWKSGDPLPTAALYHRCNTGDLHMALLASSTPANTGRAFFDCGDFGDTIYKLPTVRAMGGGSITLGVAERGKVFGVREPMTKARAELIVPLLQRQSYIGGASFGNCATSTMIDLSQMRRWHYPPIGDIRLNLTDRCSLWYLNQRYLWRQAWITADRRAVARVVINRTARWHGNLEWKRILSRFKGDCAFIGTRDEHRAFVAEFGAIAHHPTRDLLEAAEVIAGAELFCGNQSACYAIAEGMKQTTIIEICPGAPDCQYTRDNRYESLAAYVAATAKRHCAQH